MNMKTVIPLVVAIVLAVVAAKLGKDMIAKGKTDTGPGLKMNKIVVAKGDVAPGSVLKETDLTTSNIPAEGAPVGTFLDPKELVDRVVMTQLVKGQVVMDTLLAQKGASGGAASMVPAGMRAVTIEVNEVSGVAGLITPGCKVDLVQTMRMKDEDAENNMMAKTIVEDLRVIAVGRRTSTVGPEPEQLARSVTMLATQEQAEVIDLASRMGTPRLVLRNTLDNKKLGGKGVTVASLRGGRTEEGSDADLLAKLFGNPTTKPTKGKALSKAGHPAVTVPVSVPAPVMIPQFRDVEIIRGGASSNVKFPVAPTTPSGPMTGGSDKLEPAIPGSR